MTKYCDNASPQMTVMVMVGETLPHGILRVNYMPEDGKFKVIEFVMKNVQYDSPRLASPPSRPQDLLHLDWWQWR